MKFFQTRSEYNHEISFFHAMKSDVYINNSENTKPSWTPISVTINGNVFESFCVTLYMFYRFLCMSQSILKFNSAAKCIIKF